MEELKKLEETQKILMLMQSNGVVSSSHNNKDDCNRFLASLILLMVKPCGDLKMNEKCNLIAQFLPKISASFLEEASALFNPEVTGCRDICSGNDIWTVSDSVSDDDDLSQEDDFEEMAMISFDSMQRANSTLEDFCRSYFMFHGMDINSPQVAFRFLPVLAFTESYIYMMDSLNEEMVNFPINRDAVRGGCKLWKGKESWTWKCMGMFKTDPFSPLVAQLECCGLLTDRIIEELKSGEEYWALERKLCSAIICQKEIFIEDVMRAIHLKSFDYRVLNILLYQLRGEKVNELYMEFLSISEFLVEVSDDLFDYEDDVIENNFNILRMFVAIYGPSLAPVMLAKHIAEAEEKYNTLLKSLDPQLSLNYQKRCEEATKEGGKICGHPFGTWNIPPLIVNEDLHRMKIMKCSNSK